ncbi:MAG: putative rane protein [Solirubrobacteraceae bacterium]|jgi:cytochrome c oxidase assembly factor CtaG|nr:putative rane protein [Solirubrobacteraceae bacterium]
MAPDASWSLNPLVLAGVALTAGVYVVRWHRARREGGARTAPTLRLVCFLGGVAVLLAALVSPIDSLGAQILTMHMVQHVLLLDVAPILLIVGLTRALFRPATRRLVRVERAAGPLAHPIFAVVLYVAVMWGWHVPALYDAAARHDAVHALEHVSFAAAGGLYWWHLLSPIRSRRRLPGLGPVAYMAATKLLVGLLGIVLTFAPHALYDFYAHQPRYWGLSPSDDQSVAGLVMALEQSIVMGIALAVLFIRMLSESEREEQRAERYGTT